MMIKAIALGVAAVSVVCATAARADEGDKTVISSPPLTTSRGTTDPMHVGVDHLSRKNPRDFVENPTGVSMGANLGVGLGEAWGFGFGARGGYTLPMRLYFGGMAGYHVGTSSETLGVKSSQRTWYTGPEVGYDLGVGRVLVRPVLGLALAFNRREVNTAVSANSDTDTKVYAAPGASIIVPVGNFYLGADSRALIANSNPTITFMGAAGVHL